MGIDPPPLPSEEDVSIVPLTPSLVAELKAQAAIALNGSEKSCSLRMLSTTCFAIEACARGAPYSSMKLDMLMQHPFRWVAIGPGREFVGCVSAQEACRDGMRASLFPSLTTPPRALFLYNFCVAEAFRGKGVGRRLMNAVLNERGADHVYLMVDKLDPTERDEDKRRLYETRIRGLLERYERMGFVHVTECGMCHLMRHV